jgi:hypothetical protein
MFFTDGFQDANGNFLSDSSGNKLTAFFSLHLDTQLMLNATDTEGDYEFAVISDDGSILSVGTNGSTTANSVLINDDHTHGSEMVCATKTVHLIPGIPVPLHIDYFQGPPVSIALMLMWRPIATSAAGVQTPALLDDACNPNAATNHGNYGAGDNYFFNDFNNVTNPTTTQTTQVAVNPPIPLAPYNNLLLRGWSVVPANNFYLPGGITNPCATTPSLPLPSAD